MLLDLNPQFKELRLAQEKEIHWNASDGHEVKGGLYYPVDYIPGNKYPLVIQTHIFIPGHFFIDGPYTTAFAARPLAGMGIMVLQMDEMDGHYDDVGSYEVLLKEVGLIEAAIVHLEKEGLIDPNRVGIIGFSVTCTDVAYALAHSKQHFAAASLADGQDGGYFGYLGISNAAPSFVSFFEGINGGSPFGKVLKLWMERSPGFNADKIQTPLRIVANNRSSLIIQWELFAALTLLKKPVEMIYMQDGSHVLEKPWQRMISQQGNVDWFAFWLNGEEDSNPAKAEQYSRWRELRNLQEQSMKKFASEPKN